MRKTRKNSWLRWGFFGTVSLALLGCTRTCVGTPELGSKQRPVRFYLDGWTRKDDSLVAFSAMSRCLEENTGYRISFEIAADEKAVAAALGREEADLGYLTALGYLDASERYPIQSLLVLSKRGEPSTRSVIVGKTSRWRASLSAFGISLSPAGLRSERALSPIDGARFVYVSPESDVGFYVPRHILLQRNVFPEEAVFAGSFELVLQSISRDIAVAGAVAESFVEERFPNTTPLQVGTTFGDFVTLAISQGLPGKVVAYRQNLPQRLVPAIIAGLDVCAKNANKSNFEKVFSGDGFFKSTDRMFDFLRELRDFQKEYVRVLSPQEP